MIADSKRVAHYSKKMSRYLRALLFFLFFLMGVALLFDKLFPLNLEKYKNVSPVLLDRRGELLSLHLTQDDKIRLPVKLTEVDPLFIRLLINYEDKRFYSHPGVDPFALLRALGQTVFYGRRISGGSTLTMQVARLLKPRPRNIKNKCLEILRALQLEYHFSKNTLLEMYLCLAPYGGNLEGIRAASLSYFDKEPKYLNPAEAALLAVLPQSPTQLRPEFANIKTKIFRDKLINRMLAAGIFTKEQCVEAGKEALPTKKIAFPKIALHLLMGKASEKEKEKEKLVIRSTLDKQLQIQIENYVKSILPFLEPTQNAAAIVVDNKTGEILAYIGSADFFDEKRLGQVDMLKAIRSPGSTLKPFIYGLGFDQKLLHPETIVQDIPTGFSGYAPNNFKDVFHGEVTIREALQQSLNIPAVLALDKIGPGYFCDWLKNAGVHLKFRDKTTLPSLPIALGGVGTRFIELVSLYVALGNEGIHRPLKLFSDKSNISFNSDGKKHKNIHTNEIAIYSKNDKSNKNGAMQEGNEHQLLSKEATWHITKILQETRAPDGFVDNQFIGENLLAYKTGTSYGYRDAWAIGYSPAFTIGVWVGKADGTPSINQTGRNTAAPILFKLLGLLPKENQKQWSTIPPEGILSLKAHELPKSLRLLQRHDTSSNLITKTKPFQIQFPKNGSIIHLDTEKPLQFILSGGTTPYYVFVNGEPLNESFTKSHIAWQAKKTGFVEFSVMDSMGQSDSVSIEMK